MNARVGDRRFIEPYLRVKQAAQRAEAIRGLDDADVIAALAGAGAEGDPLIANILATEAQNRISLYGTIQATMGEGVFAVGPLCRVVAMNPAAERMLGWSSDEAKGRPIDEMLAATLPAHGAHVGHALCADVLSDVVSKRHEEATFQRKDGTRFWASYIASPIVRDGDVLGAVVVFRDITGRRHAEEDARRLAAIVTASDDAIVSFALDGTILSWNPRAEKIFGTRAEAALGRHGKSVLPAQFHDDLDALLRVPQNGGGPLRHMAKHIERDGNVVHLSITATHVLDDERNVIALAWIAEDVTKATDREEALRQSDQRYRLLLDSASDHAIFQLDPKGYVATWNPAAERIKGWKAEEIIGWHYSILAPPEEVANGDPWMELDIAKKEGSYSAEVRRIRKDGKIFDASVTLSAMRDPEGELIGFVKVTRDVSQRKEWERELETRDAHYRELFSMLRAPGVWCDPSGQIALTNPALCDAVGLSADDLHGRGLLSLCREADREAAREALDAAKAGERRRVAFSIVGPAGKTLAASWDLRPIVRGGVGTGFFAIGEASRS